MFWSKPTMTLPAEEQEWIDQSFNWLLKQFGNDYFLRRQTVLPVAAAFPDRYDGNEDSALQVFRRICVYMDVDPDSVEVSFFEDWEQLSDNKLKLAVEEKPGAAGYYYHPKEPGGKMRIALRASKLLDPIALVATIAHELGHVILLGGGRISRDQEKHEHLTDLITVFLGMGIFTANAAFQFHQWRSHSHQGWKASRLGYMSEEMFGYSLAGYCWLRQEPKPRWTDLLNMNVRHYFKNSLAYLNKGGHSGLTLPTGGDSHR
jgi:hypothetical protein